MNEATRPGTRRRNAWRRPEAVSPVVGEILMVSITVVLAGSLFYYMQANQSGTGKIEPPLGCTVERLPGGNWTITVVKGRSMAADATLLVKNPDTGVATVSSTVTLPNQHFYFNDNNGDSFLDAGDIILLNQTAGLVEAGYHLEIVKTGGTLSGPLTLPG